MNNEEYSPILICSKCQIKLESLEKVHEQKSEFLDQVKEEKLKEYTCNKCRI
jgi:hypothetical protein